MTRGSQHLVLVATTALALTLILPVPALADFGFPPPSNLTTLQGLVRGIVVTLLAESLIVAWYCRSRGLPISRCLIACAVGNALTLPVVWFLSVLGWFFLAFIGVLVFLLVELGAAVLEGVLYTWIGRLNLSQGLRLGLIANAATMALGVIDQAVHFQPKQGPPQKVRSDGSRPASDVVPVKETSSRKLDAEATEATNRVTMERRHEYRSEPSSDSLGARDPRSSLRGIGHPVWLVYGHRGEQQVVAKAESQSAAWNEAARLAAEIDGEAT